MAFVVRCAGISLVALAIFLQAFGITAMLSADSEFGWPIFSYSIPAAFTGSLLVSREPTMLGEIGAKLSLSVIGVVVIGPAVSWLALLAASTVLG